MVCDLNRAIKWNVMQPDEFRHATVRSFEKQIKGANVENLYVRFSSIIQFIWAFAVEKNGEKLKLWLFGELFSDVNRKKSIAKLHSDVPTLKGMNIDCMFVEWLNWTYSFTILCTLCGTVANSIRWNVLVIIVIKSPMFSLRWNDFFFDCITVP